MAVATSPASEGRALLRRAALTMLSLGYERRDAAVVFEVSEQTLRNWENRAASGDGALRDAARPGRPSVLSSEWADLLREIASQQASASVRKAVAELASQGGPNVSLASALGEVHRIGRRHRQVTTYVGYYLDHLLHTLFNETRLTHPSCIIIDNMTWRGWAI